VFVIVYVLTLFNHFFFSSRRRHTRSKRDWSSDVCSSDLNVAREGNDITIVAYGAEVNEALKVADSLAEKNISVEVIDLRTVSPRSEERRVGKECRSKWGRSPLMEKKVVRESRGRMWTSQA